jgi:hypothetical protein
VHWRFDIFIDECRADGFVCIPGRWPASTAYSAFTGAFGLLDVVLGVLAVWFEVFWWLVAGLDALAVVFYLAGGVVSEKIFSCWVRLWMGC